MQLKVVYLGTRNILIFNSLYIMHDNFNKKYSGKMCWILLQETEWLTNCFRITRLCYCHRFKSVYKTLTNVAEDYFLSLNRASNITTLKSTVYKFLTQTRRYLAWKLYVLENYSQIRSKLSVSLSEKKLYWID